MMDWGQVIASAIGGGASGLVSYADEAQKAREREDLASLKGQMQMDRLQASIEGKFQAVMAGIEGKLAVQEARNSQGGSKPRGLIDLDDKGQQAASDYFGAQRKQTDRAAYERDEPLPVPNDDEGNPMPATGKKVFDAKGYANAEDERTKRNLKINTILTNPAAIDNLSKAESQDIINTVAEFALKNPKANVGELLDRLNLLKPGDKRIAADKSNRLYNESTGEIVAEGADESSASVGDMVKSIDAQRKAIDKEADEIKASRAAELKDVTGKKRDAIIEKYDAKLKPLETRRRQLDEKFDILNERVGIQKKSGAQAAKPATTTPMPTSAAPGVRSVINDIKSKQTQR